LDRKNWNRSGSSAVWQFQAGLIGKYHFQRLTHHTKKGAKIVEVTNSRNVVNESKM